MDSERHGSLSRFRTEAHLRFSRRRRKYAPSSVGVLEEEQGKGCLRGRTSREHTSRARIGAGTSDQLHRSARGRCKPLLDQRTQRTFLKLHALLPQRPSARLEQSLHERNMEPLSAWLRHLRALSRARAQFTMIRCHTVQMCRMTKY